MDPFLCSLEEEYVDPSPLFFERRIELVSLPLVSLRKGLLFPPPFFIKRENLCVPLYNRNVSL